MNALRLAFGTLTVFPVRAPAVDRRTAGRAMLLAPLVGLALAVPAVLLVVLLRDRVGPLLLAALVVGMLALLTRGMHLDGLADTADGLGSGRPAEGALDVMRRGDVGPFGVVTLVLVLLVQVAAVTELLTSGHAPAGLAAALVVSRLALPLMCLDGVPAARTDGLGATVAGSVSRTAAVLAIIIAGLALLALAAVAGQRVLLVQLGLLAGLGLGFRAARRFGGITGDVLGAVVEATFTVALVVLVVVA